jgi:hypothetical protein
VSASWAHTWLGSKNSVEARWTGHAPEMPILVRARIGCDFVQLRAMSNLLGQTEWVKIPAKHQAMQYNLEQQV